MVWVCLESNRSLLSDWGTFGAIGALYGEVRVMNGPAEMCMCGGPGRPAHNHEQQIFWPQDLHAYHSPWLSQRALCILCPEQREQLFVTESKIVVWRDEVLCVCVSLSGPQMAFWVPWQFTSSEKPGIWGFGGLLLLDVPCLHLGELDHVGKEKKKGIETHTYVMPPDARH